MTEIVQNNNGMKFDLLETGIGGTGIPEGDGFFNSLLGSVDTNGENYLQEYEVLEDEEKSADGNVFQILNLLQESEFNFTKDTLDDIKKSLKDLFQKLELNFKAQQNVHLEQASNFANESFLHLMKFLEELESLILSQGNNKNINRELDLLLDKVRAKLNEKIKNTLTAKISQNDTEKNVIKIKAHDQIDTAGSGDQNSYGKNISNMMNKSSKELRDIQTRKVGFGHSKSNEPKAEADKKFSSNPKSLNISHHQENKISKIQGAGNRNFEKSMEASSQNSINGSLLKETNLEP